MRDMFGSVFVSDFLRITQCQYHHLAHRYLLIPFLYPVHYLVKKYTFNLYISEQSLVKHFTSTVLKNTYTSVV